MHEHIVLALAGIGLITFVCQWVAWRLKLPAILFLLLAGILAGPVFGWLDPDKLFGDLLIPFVSLSVAVILFEGSLTLRLEEIRGVEKVVRIMVTSGILLTGLITSLFTHYLIGFSWQLSFLFGALTVVTGPTVIVPMLRSVRPTARISNILRWEGILIDPIGALLAVLVFEFIISGQNNAALGHTFWVFGKVLLVGSVIGIGTGYFLGLLLRHHMIPEYLHNVTTLTLVFAAFALSNAAEAESGLLAVTLMGMWLANMKNVPVHDILDFKESLSIMLISGLFIILAARMDFADIQTLGWAALGVFLAIQFIARPLKVAYATRGSNLNWRERALLGWIAPRGIVAAAMSAVFALRLSEAGYEDAALLVPLTFIVIIGTVVLQSATSRPLANWLGVSEPEPRGFMIIGTNRVARTIAGALKDNGYQTLLVDTNWAGVRSANMEGHRTYYGSPVSDHADRHLDLVGIGRMLGLSSQPEINSLAAMRYRSEFGPSEIYVLPVEAPKASASKQTSTERVGHQLFTEKTTYQDLVDRLVEGAKIHSTKLTESFNFDDYRQKYQQRAVILFAIDNQDRLIVMSGDKKINPGVNWTLISLITPEPAPETDDTGTPTQQSHS